MATVDFKSSALNDSVAKLEADFVELTNLQATQNTAQDTANSANNALSTAVKAVQDKHVEILADIDAVKNAASAFDS
jgi:hypothetical protein